LRSLPGFESGRTGPFIAAGAVRSDRARPATWLEIARHRCAGKNVIDRWRRYVVGQPLPVAILKVGRRHACPTNLDMTKRQSRPRNCKACHVERAKHLSILRSASERSFAVARDDRIVVNEHVHIPIATYRLQFNKNFTFRQAREIVPYLDQLGISHAYASPYFQAGAESLHGYDITDHNQLNAAIGSRKDYDAWIAKLRSHGMGQIVD